MIHTVYLGRFSPIHKGHQKIIDKLLETYSPDNIIIMIGSSNVLNEKTPYTITEREKMFNILYPNLIVIPIPDYDDDKSWLDNIKKIEKDFNTTFTFFGGSIEDLKILNTVFNTKVLVDRNLLKFNISATLVRKYIKAGQFNEVAPLIDPKIFDFVIDIDIRNVNSGKS